MTNTAMNPTLEEIAGLIRSVDLGSDASRLLTRLARLLAQGTPVSDTEVAGLISELGIDKAQAHEHLTAYAERDGNGDLIGALPGLTLRHTTHSFTTDTAQLWAWCAADTLILPIVLNQEAHVASEAPRSREIVRFTATPGGVHDVQPAGAVVSIPGLVGGRGANEDLHLVIDLAETTAVEQIWGAFCHHTHAFSSLDEARQWSAGRDDVTFVPVTEAFRVVRGFADGLLAHG